MDFTLLKIFSFRELKDIAISIDIKPKRSKQALLEDIIKAFKEYEDYKLAKIDKYKKIKQLGKPGKEGVTFLVRTKDGKEYAMKTFRKQKSSTTLRKEMELQKQASKYGIAPVVIGMDTISKYIVMEKMDKHLLDIMKKQEGDLKKIQQYSLLKIFRKLDEAGIFHGDANLLNYMYKGRQLYIIDFGMAKPITPHLTKKLSTDKPNMSIMLLGLVLKLKDMNCPKSSYKYLLPYLSEHKFLNF
jgi:tRNA A-37 threonylcarbamoyl transferase component Bud32